MERVATRKQQQTPTLVLELFLLVELELWEDTALDKMRLTLGLEGDMAGTALVPAVMAPMVKSNCFGR